MLPPFLPKKTPKESLRLQPESYFQDQNLCARIQLIFKIWYLQHQITWIAPAGFTTHPI